MKILDDDPRWHVRAALRERAGWMFEAAKAAAKAGQRMSARDWLSHALATLHCEEADRTGSTKNERPGASK